VTTRRDFLGIVGSGLVLAPAVARAQAAAKVRRIGVLAPWPFDAPQYEPPLRELGWIEGKNMVTERRFTGGVEGLPGGAAELVRLKVDLIITDGTDAALTAKKATTNIPIVMAAVGDPVGMGIVGNLAHPGGNITGYSMAYPEITVKRASLLHELLPTVQRVGLIFTQTSAGRSLRKLAETTYRSFGVTPIGIDQSVTRQGLQDAIAEASRQRAEALDLPLHLEPEDATAIMGAVVRNRLPALVSGRRMLEAGGVMSFDNKLDDQGRRVAMMIDKILRGAKAGDMPIEQPTSFELLINLRTAKSLGIAVPQPLLARADEVIR
jgi:putative ABC transport system substrate-binding protein